VSQSTINLALPLLALAITGCANHPKSVHSIPAEARAIAFLQREVPAWSRENGCFSCHNNGDAARALFAAQRHGYKIPRAALADTIAWVTTPQRWNDNKGDPGFSDQRLADIQFTASLAAAIESKSVRADSPLHRAAITVAQAQAEDGSWPIDVANPVGSPTTYGATLATFMAWDSLRRVTSPEISPAQRKAEARLLATKPDSVPHAEVVLLLQSRGHEAANRGYEASLNFLRRTQTSDGGWGPYADSPPEAFDTALALLALAEYRATDGVAEMTARGRAYLATTQLPDGSWPATTRPPGGHSYAQQMSTTGWATLALLATR
jgi:hypothetical protein